MSTSDTTPLPEEGPKDERDEGKLLVVPIPVYKNKEQYNMEYSPRGRCLIFYHDTFDYKLQFRERAEYDCKNLEQTMKNLGFSVEVFKNLKHSEIEANIDLVADYDHTHCEALVIAFLTHGLTGRLYAKDERYDPYYLFQKFNADCCPTLTGKPKIFILDVNQGKRPSQIATDARDHSRLVQYPTEADFLVVYSTVKASDYVFASKPVEAAEKMQEHSWFIDTFCEKIQLFAYTLNLVQIITLVCDEAKRNPQVQTPCIFSRLTRVLQFEKLDDGKGVDTTDLASCDNDELIPFYPFDREKRGLCFIFNHEKVDGQLVRTGTKIDLEKIKNTMRKLKFEVQDYQDLTKSQIVENLEEISSRDFTHYNCLCVFVLTHGAEGILCAKDTAYNIDLLWSKFTSDLCPTLAGKPKVFFVQACREQEGRERDKFDRGVWHVTENDAPNSIGPIHVPSEGDFLIAHSTSKGKYSWRTEKKGTWFIQTLCEELDDKGSTMDLVGILTIVNRRVAKEFQSNARKYCPIGKVWTKLPPTKQIPCFYSMLAGLVYFTPVDKGSSVYNTPDDSSVSTLGDREDCEEKGVSKSSKMKNVLKRIFSRKQ